MGEGQKIEVVRVAQGLDSHFRLLGRKRLAGICEGLPFPGVELALDHVSEGIPVPALSDRCTEIPVAGCGILDTVK